MFFFVMQNEKNGLLHLWNIDIVKFHIFYHFLFKKQTTWYLKLLFYIFFIIFCI